MIKNNFTRDLDTYVDTVLYPAIAANLTAVFPTLNFRQKGSGYYYSDTDLQGQQHRGKTVLFCKYEGGYLSIGANDMDAAGLAQYAKGGARGVDVITLYRALNGHPTYTEAVKALANLVGAPLDTYPQGGFTYDAQPAEDRETAQDAFAAELWKGTPAAAAALDFLRNKNGGAGWSDNEIKQAGIGLATPSVLAYLEKKAPKWYPRTDAEGKPLPTASAQGFGTTWQIAVPMYYGTKIDGFNFRVVGALPEGVKNKYKVPAGKPRDVFSGLLAGYKESLILVEGELDALKARINGVGNVVDYGMNEVTAARAANAVARGVRKFTLVPDNDTKEGIASTAQPGVVNIEKSIANLYDAGATDVYIAPLQAVVNEATGKVVKDTEEYIATFGVDAWKAAVDSAKTKAAPYLANRAFMKYTEKGKFSVEDKDALFAELEHIALDKHTDYNTLSDVYNTISAWLQVPGNAEYFRFDLEAFKQYVAGRRDREAEQLATLALSNDTTKAAELFASGCPKEAAKLLRDSLTKNTGTSRSEYLELFAAPTDPEKDITAIPEGLPTGLYFLTADNDIQELTLKEGVSLLVGARKHGKTTILCNFALNEAKRNIANYQAGIDSTLKKVLLYSYEVTAARLYQKLLAIYLNNEAIGKNSARSILSYYKGNEADYFQGGAEGEGFQAFIAQKDAFFADYIRSGAITVVTNEKRNLAVEELAAATDAFLAAGNQVSLICLDYIQKLHSNQVKNAPRTEELKYIGEVLSNFANPRALPMLCAAQFNRQVLSLIDVLTENIGEAGDIERNGVDVIGIYNLKELRYISQGAREIVPGNKDILQRFGVEGATKYYDFGDNSKATENLTRCPGKVYISLMASRFDEAPAEIITDFVGSTGYVDFASTKAIATEAQTRRFSAADGENAAQVKQSLTADLTSAKKRENRLAEAEEKATEAYRAADAKATASERDADNAQQETLHTAAHTVAELPALRDKAKIAAAKAVIDRAAANHLKGIAEEAQRKRVAAGDEIMRIQKQLQELQEGGTRETYQASAAEDFEEYSNFFKNR